MTKLSADFFRANETVQDQLADLIDPLTVHFGIDLFWHMVQYEDGRCSSLCTRYEEWANVWSQEHYRDIGFLVSPSNLHAGYYLLEFDGTYKAFQDCTADEFPLYHPLLIARKTAPGRADLFGFGSSVHNPQLLSTYLNHMGVLNKCIDHHLQEHSQAISKAVEVGPNMAKLRGEHAFYCMPYDGGVVQDSTRNLEILDHLGIPADLLSAAARLSRREKEVVDACTQGLTAGQTGVKLSLSQRTVEYYLECAKVKLGLYTKPELSRTGQLLKVAGLLEMGHA